MPSQRSARLLSMHGSVVSAVVGRSPRAVPLKAPANPAALSPIRLSRWTYWAYGILAGAWWADKLLFLSWVEIVHVRSSLINREVSACKILITRRSHDLLGGGRAAMRCVVLLK
jgi:hypothetical protein